MPIVLSCEHATNAVPAAYADLFSAPEALAALASHQGWDIGAYDLARRFLPLASDGLHAGQVSRLLIEANRSPTNPERWSRFARQLDEPTRDQLHEHYFVPHLEAVRRSIGSLIAEQGEALHLSVHTFTRVWRGACRHVDIGVLFDPERMPEARIARTWINRLAGAFPPWRVEANKPYRGTEDGLTTLLRTEFSPSRYIGLELEVCNDLIPSLLANPATCERLVASLPTAAA